MQHIHKYTRNRSGNLNGVVLAAKADNGRIIFGWSLCSKKDAFNKEFGVRLALNRALVNPNKVEPHSIKRDYQQMRERATRYYKPMSKA